MDVKDTMSLKDETVEIRLLNIPNPHSDGMIIGHVVGPNIVYVTDLLSPRGPIARTPGTVAVGDALKKHGITGSTIAGGHGTTAKQAEIGHGAGGELRPASCPRSNASAAFGESRAPRFPSVMLAQAAASLRVRSEAERRLRGHAHAYGSSSVSQYR